MWTKAAFLEGGSQAAGSGYGLSVMVLMGLGKTGWDWVGLGRLSLHWWPQITRVVQMQSLTSEALSLWSDSLALQELQTDGLASPSSHS